MAPESAQRTDEGDATPVAPAATRVYASPEVLAGEDPEPRDDVFSLACVTYEMLAGAHPYGRHGADAALREGIAPQPVAGLDDARWAVLAAALDPVRAGRPAMADFERALRNEPVAQPPEPILAAVAPAEPPPACPDSTAGRTGSGRGARATACEAHLARRHRGRPCAPARHPDRAIQHERREPGSGRAAAEAGSPRRRRRLPSAPPVVVPSPAVAEATTPPAEADVPVGPPGMVFFDAPGMVVSKRAVVAAIPMRHLSRVKRAVNVNWRLIEGTARPGRDYGGPESGVESFVEGNSFRILYVPILANPGSARDRAVHRGNDCSIARRGARADAPGRGHDPRRIPERSRQRSCRTFDMRIRASGRAFEGSASRSSSSMRAGIAFSAVSRSASGTGLQSR